MFFYIVIVRLLTCFHFPERRFTCTGLCNWTRSIGSADECFVQPSTSTSYGVSSCTSWPQFLSWYISSISKHAKSIFSSSSAANRCSIGAYGSSASGFLFATTAAAATSASTTVRPDELEPKVFEQRKRLRLCKYPMRLRNN